MRIKSLFNPTQLAFPIFWFPILLPMMVTLISVRVDAITVASVQQSITAIICRNLNLAFVSTDLWALTTLLMESSKGKLEGVSSWSLGLGQIMTLFVHILFYIIINPNTNLSSYITLYVLISVIGFLIVTLTRYWVYVRIERPEMIRLSDPTRDPDSL